MKDQIKIIEAQYEKFDKDIIKGNAVLNTIRDIIGMLLL